MAKALDRIVVNEWYKGVAASAQFGFYDMRNVDATSAPGLLKCAFKPTKKTGTTVTGVPKVLRKDPGTGYYFLLDDDQKVYRSQDGGETWAHVSGNTSVGNGQGMEIWQNYLFVFAGGGVDVLGPLNGSPGWTNNWASASWSFSVSNDDPVFHPSLVWDSFLFFARANKIYRIYEEAGQTFAPGNSATYNINSGAAVIEAPEQERIRSIRPSYLGLAFGTWKSTTDAVANIYFWDTFSVNFSRVLPVNDYGIRGMVENNNLIYFIAGSEGSLYVTDGSTVSKVTQLPQELVDLSGGKNVDVYPEAIMYHNDKIVFGVSAGAGQVNPLGVWSYDIVNKTLQVQNTISTGSVGDDVLTIGCLLPKDSKDYFIGWEDQETSAKGVDLVDSDNRVTSYSAMVITPMYGVGTPYVPRIFTALEIYLNKALNSGEGVRISYRTTESDSFTTLFTFDYSTYGALKEFQYPTSFEGVNVQLKIEMTTSGSGILTPELKSVQII